MKVCSRCHQQKEERDFQIRRASRDGLTAAYHTEMVYRQHQVLEALHNAGINVTEAGKGEAS